MMLQQNQVITTLLLVVVGCLVVTEIGQASYLTGAAHQHSMSTSSNHHQFIMSNQVAQQQQQQHPEVQQHQPTINPVKSGQSLVAPTITPFAISQPVQENQRYSVFCSIPSGDPVSISWLKDSQLLTPTMAQLRRIVIKSDGDHSTLKFNPVKLEHAGNYTCLAQNGAGQAQQSAQLVVHGEPRWVHPPHSEPVLAIRGQTVVIDCQTTGFPRPQQVWQIKTHNATGFEPLAATGRISLAANGSLVIRNADKSDEANYLCRSTNGIGKGVSSATSLKVTVPAHFDQATKMQSVVPVRGLSPVQLRCDAHGDEPLQIEWLRNKQRLSQLETPDTRYSIHNTPISNGLISLLVIKKSERSDNAVFECVARNQVGRDRVQMELQVQEKPDKLAELQASQPQARSVSLIWSEPYDGRSPIISYQFQYRKLGDLEPQTSDVIVSSSIGHQTASPSSSGLISSADRTFVPSNQQHFGDYRDNLDTHQWQSAKRLLVAANETTLIGGGLIAAELAAAASGSLPVQTQSYDKANQVAPVRSVNLAGLEPSSRYLLRAEAINSIGSSEFSQPMEFSTEDEAPELPAGNVQATALNSTSIQVSWDEVPGSLGRRWGRIDGYYIGFRVAGSGSSNATLQQVGGENFIYKPFVIKDMLQGLPARNRRLEFTLHELRRDTQYELTVVAFNSRGSGPASETASCRTKEMEAPRPVRIRVRHELNESIFIEWHRDPNDQNPVDDYVLFQEKNSNSQEWLQVRLPANQTHYKAPGLKCGTRYKFYVIAGNKAGKSAQSEVVSASTSGAAPEVPSKQSLIKMLNDTCLQVNLNAFQDNGCRIKSYTLRYRIEQRVGGGATGSGSNQHLIGANGIIAAHSALQSGQQQQQQHQSGKSGSTGSGLNSFTPGEWVTVRAGNGHLHGHHHSGSSSSSSSSNNNNNNNNNNNINSQQQQVNKMHRSGSSSSPSSLFSSLTGSSSSQLGDVTADDRLELICNLSPVADYSIHVSATNEVGRSEAEYLVSMSSDELRHSIWRDGLELLNSVPHLFAFILAALLLLLAGLVLYTTAARYYQKLVIIQNQMRAGRRAKRDEQRRRKLQQARQSQKLELWADEFEEADDDCDDEPDDDLEQEDEEELDDDLEGQEESNQRQARRMGEIDSLGRDSNADRLSQDQRLVMGTIDRCRSRQQQRIRSAKLRNQTRQQQQSRRRQIAAQRISSRPSADESTTGMEPDTDSSSAGSSAGFSQSQKVHIGQQQQQQQQRLSTGNVQLQRRHSHLLAGQSVGCQATNGRQIPANLNRSAPGRPQHNQLGNHYLSNLNSTFDSSSIDSRSNLADYRKFNRNPSSCNSTASTDSIHNRFQCLNSRQYVKMNEYTMLPTLSGSIAATGNGKSTTSVTNVNPSTESGVVESIYGIMGGHRSQLAPSGQQSQNPSLYYSTLRRASNMQTYLPSQQQAPHVHHHHHQQQQQDQQHCRVRSQNHNDIYGYYVPPATQLQQPQQQQQQQQHQEDRNCIFVPPQQIIYSAPNIRRTSAAVYL